MFGEAEPEVEWAGGRRGEVELEFEEGGALLRKVLAGVAGARYRVLSG
jgi:hypothetical protein